MPSANPMRQIRIVVAALLATVLVACGDGSGQERVPGTPQPTLTGVLVDSPVSGVTWKASGGGSGVTSSLGEFQYVQPESGTYVETVTFSVGDIVLGTAPGIPFKGDRIYVTAVELTNSFDPLNRAATNQLVFVQSIDADGDPTNGITISEATQAAAVGQTLDFDSPDFATEVAEVVAVIAPGNRVVTDTEALDHFYTTYAALGGTDTFNFLFPGYPPVGEGSDEFQLVFADEFDSDGAPNPAVWNIDLGYGPNGFGWGNDEWQLYTDSPDNLRVEDGNLVITALCPAEPCGVRDGTITSGRITTVDKFEFRYGKVVARIKPPVGKGTWPAFWALGANFPEIGWPRSGEINFMEVFNNTNNDDAQSAVAERTATSAMHWCDERIVTSPLKNCFPAGRRFEKGELDTGESLNNDFQIWEADWNADRVIVSINGIQYFELDINPATMEEFRRDFFLLLNVAMGGTLGSGGTPPTGDETFPQTMLVDYVRVYQQVDDITPPELTAVTIASNNANPSFATTGDIVTVTLTANETILEPVVTIGGIAATTVTGSGIDWQASRALTGEDAEGVVEFSVEYVDLAGNAGVPVSASTDGSSVTVDATTPQLNTVTIASSNTNPELATAGDVVTVTLAADEAITPPVVTIGGATATSVGSGANWTASRTLTAGEAQGVIAFSINFADFAGNAGVPVAATTDSSSVTVDSIAPSVAIAGAPPTFSTLAPIPLQFNFSEPVSGFEVGDIQVTNGGVGNLAGDGEMFTADVTPTGLGDLIVGVPAGAAADATGNASTAAADVVIMNMLPVGTPLLTAVSIASNNANTNFARAGDVVTVSFTADRNIQQVAVTIAGAAATVTGSGDTYTATRTALVTDPEGPIAFAINFEDTLGTPGFETTVTTDSSAVEFDVTQPTLAIEGLPTDIKFLDPIPVTFRFDEDVSGFDVTDIDVTNGSVGAFAAVDAAVYTAEITPDGASDLTVAVAADAAADAAGNGNESVSEVRTVGAAWGFVWGDDFEAPGLDAGLWTARTDADCPDPCDGVQEYQSERVTVAGGLLTIEARDEGAFFTSGIIDTRDNRMFDLKYGRVEIDAIMPGTQGTLPSLRLLPVPATPSVFQDGNYGPWPQSGELDLVNAPNLGPSNSTLEHTLRYGLPEPEDTATTATSAAPGVPTLDLIEYAIEWEGGEIRWFVNDVHVATQTQDNWYGYFEDADGVYTLGADAGQPAAPFDQDFYVVIGLAVGNDADSFFPQTLEIDAVRVYECVNPADPATGTGCSTGTGVPAEVAPSEPYVEMLEVYTDAPATLDFVEPDGMGTTPGTLLPATFGDDPSVVVTSTIDALDGTDTVWNVDVQAAGGAGGVTMGAGISSHYFDLSGGATAGEVLFRMRVNSVNGNPQLAVGLEDRAGGVGRASLEFVANGVWRNYSYKIADVVADSIFNGTSLDIADVGLMFGIEASGGDINLDLDDIQVKVACRDVGGCEATPRVESAPAEVVYEEDFEALTLDDPAAVGPAGAGFRYFADVWGNFDGDPPWLVGEDIALNSYFGDAPNASAPGIPDGFSAIETGDGGPEQGDQYVSIFSDYNNPDQNGQGVCGNFVDNDPCTINTSVFIEPFNQTDGLIAAEDLGFCWTFSFDARSNPGGGIADATIDNGGNFLQAPTSASAYLKTLNPQNAFNTTNDVRVDMTNISNTDWVRFSINLELSDPLLVGQILQFGFNTIATEFDASAVLYDNLEVTKRGAACPAP